MEFNTENGRIWLENKDGKMTAEVVFPSEDENTVNITHTFVDDSLRGQGIAAKLMEAVSDKLRLDGKKAVLTCSYAKAWFPKHPQYKDVVK